jgi:RNA polymerase sigma-70 factor, ECF subfamily
MSRSAWLRWQPTWWNFPPSQTEYVQSTSNQEDVSAALTANRVPDDELVQRTAAGDAEAFAALYRRRRPDVFRFALHMTADGAVAEDVVQDVFVTVMQDAGRFESGRAAVAAWLCGIARNHLRQRLARDRRLEPLAHDEDEMPGGATVQPDALVDLLRLERIESLRRAVLSLPFRYREAVVLCDLQEMSYQDAADALSCAVGTVRSRLHRGRALLAAKLTASGAGNRVSKSRETDPNGGQGLDPRTLRAAPAVLGPGGCAS